jgi:hypothetical protein
MPFKANPIEIIPATPDESNVELFKKAITKEMSLADFEMYIMRPNIKQYCHKIIARKYGVIGADKILKYKPPYVVLNAMRECTQLSFLNGKGYNITNADNKGHNIRQVKSVHLSPANKSKDNNTANLLNLTYIQNFNDAPMNHQRPFTSAMQNSSLNGSYIKIPCAVKFPMTLDDMDKVIKQADTLTKENKIFNISMTMKPKNRTKSETAKTLNASPAIKTIPTYSKCPKEMDYKTFAMVYRIKQRCRTMNYSSIYD